MKVAAGAYKDDFNKYPHDRFEGEHLSDDLKATCDHPFIITEWLNLDKNGTEQMRPCTSRGVFQSNYSTNEVLL